MQCGQREKSAFPFPEPFGFYRGILSGDHLHLGLWADDRPGISMEDAQHEMFAMLQSFFPEPPAAVLDVGCGLGLSAALLSAKGYRVTAIAPSPELIEYAGNTYGDSGVDYRTAGFLDDFGPCPAVEQYDVILFQESAQYVSPLAEAFRKARSLLRDRGIVILCDEVCYDRSIKPETSVHLLSEFITGLAENGFNITENRKLVRNVLPGCDYIIDAFSTRFDELVCASHDPHAAEKLLLYLNGWKNQKRWYTEGQMGYEVFVARKDGFFMRAYAPGDEAQIVPMFNEVFQVNRTIEHWNWKFRDNPYGAFKISGVYTEEGALVAHYAGYPVPFCSSLGGPGRFLSFQIGDTMTKPGVRNIGLGKTGLLARVAHHFYAAFCEGLPFIYGFNTGHIRKLGSRYLGYTYIAEVPYWTAEAPGLLKNPSLLRKILSGYTVEEVRAVDGEWDRFLDRVSASYGFLVQRDREYLTWRYIKCPDRVHKLFAVRKRGNLAGWAVFAMRDSRLIWGDALFDRRFPDAIPFPCRQF